MPKPLWFAFYPFDWLTDSVVMTMPLVQQGAYIRLLCLAACNDGIPDDPTPLLGHPDVWADPLRSCWVPHPSKPGFLHNPRLLVELNKADAKRAAGSQAAKARWDKELIRPHNGRNTRALLVEESRVEKRRSNHRVEPLGNLLPPSLLRRESNNDATTNPEGTAV